MAAYHISHHTPSRTMSVPSTSRSPTPHHLEIPRRSSTASMRTVASSGDEDTGDSFLAQEVEPGIDVTRSDYSDVWYKKDLAITVADWSANKARVRTEMDNSEFLHWLSTDRPAWSKARWINLNGLSWDVFKALSLKYDLHPLAVEDCLHVFDRGAISKSDWYANQLFVRLIVWQLSDPSSDTEDDDEVGSESDEEIEERAARVAAVGGNPLHTPLASRQRSREAASAQANMVTPRSSNAIQPSPTSQSDPEPVAVSFESKAAGNFTEEPARDGDVEDLEPPARRPTRQGRRTSAIPFRVSRTTGRATVAKPRAKKKRQIPQKSNSSSKKPFLGRAWDAFTGKSSSDPPDPRAKHARNSGTLSREEEEAEIGVKREFSRLAKKGIIHEDSSESDGLDSHYAARKIVQRLTHDYRIAVRRQQLSMFLTKDGTLITIFSKDGSGLTPSIEARLRSKNTLLRCSEDASMLMQAMFDVCVDKNLEIVDAFRRKLDTLEGTALVSPQVATVRHLHVMSQQLVQMKRVMSPLHNLISTLRSFDEERSTFASNTAANTPGRAGAVDPLHANTGFVSPMTKIYLTDVLDHVDSVMSSIELFMGMTQQLEDYIFNLLSFATNETMKILTYITIVFLPLGFIAGYFGMNFGTFPHVLDGDIAYFWKVSIPVIVGTLLLLASPDLLRVFNRIKRKLLHTKYLRRGEKRRRRRRKIE